MAKTLKQVPSSGASVPSDWQTRRPPNGYSYLEVLRELERRRKGDYLLSPESRTEVFQSGVMRLATQYTISAAFSVLMKEHELTPETFLSLFSCRTEDSADTLLSCVLSPYLKSKGADISNNAEVDELFPAQDLNRTL